MADLIKVAPDLKTRFQSIIGWKFLARTSLGGLSDNVTVSSLANKRYYMILCHLLNSGSMDHNWRLNADAAANYAWRQSQNGVADSTDINKNEMQIRPASTEQLFSTGYFANLNTAEKLHLTHLVGQGIAGAGNPPNRNEAVGKHVQTTNPINEIAAINLGGGDYAANSELVVLGWDPLDSHTENFWKELASVTLGGTDSNVQLTVAARKYLWIQAYMKKTATLVPWLRFNNISTGTPYAYRKSDNGEVDPAASTSQNQIAIGQSEPTPTFVNIFIINVSANEKLVIAHTAGQNTAGSANAPTRRETVAKWDSTAAQITEVDFVSSTSSFAFGSEFKVWGAD